MSSVEALIGAIVVGLIALTLGKRKKKTSSGSPPDNKAAKVATQQIKDDLNEELDVIKKATSSDSPASDLANLGNARKR